ncbi:MAG: hypothetical protein KJ620_04860 [Candidatus Edwardsbacteria bacterium]|nr:hypothetical protein [Candidatus Edwardsbacteria bacterium]MBU1575951.1 hypothetical protein [Candidatus Edwardsbacteria bacterium]MBU2463828.1 hypothetical protein [Candidatus Edwardsbacteria bacterium]MBU2593700.1 hypothetical protein [Candidatus Edwardsbacteria bacterium]
MKAKAPVKFSGMGEIRMGSPFKAGKVKVDGFDHPYLNQGDFQDRYAYDPSKQRLILVRWDPGYNFPGFYLLMLDLKKQRIFRSPTIFGCCQTMTLEEGGVVLEIFDRGNIIDKTFKLAMINQHLTHDPC